MTIPIDIIVYSIALAGIYALIAIGLNVIFGVMNVLNVAHGDFLMLGAYVAYWLFNLAGLNPFVSMLIVFLVFLFMGLIIYKFAVNKLVAKSVSASRLTNSSLLLFFGVSMAIQSLALTLWKPQYRSILYMTDTVTFFGCSISIIRLMVLTIALISIVFLSIFLKKTFLGTAIRAVSQDKEAAALMGIDVNKINAFAFGLGVACAGLGGTLICMIYVINPTIGLEWTIKSLCIIVLGGLGSFGGSLAGALFLAFAESFGSLVISGGWRNLISYAILIFIILLRPTGIMGKRSG